MLSARPWCLALQFATLIGHAEKLEAAMGGAALVSERRLSGMARERAPRLCDRPSRVGFVDNTISILL